MTDGGRRDRVPHTAPYRIEESRWLAVSLSSQNLATEVVKTKRETNWPGGICRMAATSSTNGARRGPQLVGLIARTEKQSFWAQAGCMEIVIARRGTIAFSSSKHRGKRPLCCPRCAAWFELLICAADSCRRDHPHHLMPPKKQGTSKKEGGSKAAASDKQTAKPASSGAASSTAKPAKKGSCATRPLCCIHQHFLAGGKGGKKS